MYAIESTEMKGIKVSFLRTAARLAGRKKTVDLVASAPPRALHRIERWLQRGQIDSKRSSRAAQQ